MILVVLGVCAGAFVLAGASDDQANGKTYKIIFDNAFGLVKGGDFRVGGVNAGQTTGFEVRKRKDEAPKAEVTVEVTKPGFGDFRKDASCEIRPQSLIGEYYVDCQPGKSEERLANGGTVPVEQTSSTIPTDLVNDIMRRPYRERFRLLITELGTGLAGRPDDLQEVLRRAHPGLRETSRVLGILGDQNRVIKNFITNSDTVDLERAAPELDTFFTRLGPFAEASRPAVRSLGGLGEVGTKAFHEGKQEVAELRRLAVNAPPFAKPLRQFLQTIDDRKRAIENDVRAKATAPPSPDPTAISGEGGFTGMEAVWNYFFWQTLSINMLDDDAHMLRASLTAVPDCIPFRNEPPKSEADKETFKRCNSYLGPNQPGIFSPDPLDDGSNPGAARLRADSGLPATRIGEQRGEGMPEAGPLPGQPDLSKPQLVLPPDVQQLLDSLTPRQRQELGSDLPTNPDDLKRELESLGAPAPATDQTTGQLLDYLLAP